MLDAKRALEETGGVMEDAIRWLREKGLAKAAARDQREASEGAVAAVREGSSAAIVELRSETDFVAKSPEFVSLVDDLAALVAAKGETALQERKDEIDRLRTSLQENISIGRVVRIQSAEGQVLDTYVHQQAGRGVNAVIVCLEGGSEERATVEQISRNEGKPEAALPKVVEGRMNGWFKERVLLEQAYVRDEKRSISDLLGPATVVEFAQVVVGS